MARLTGSSRSYDDHPTTADILNKDGEHCGQLFDGWAAISEKPSPTACDLVLLSRHCHNATGKYGFFRVKFKIEETEWSIMNSMLVEWKEGVAERIGIARIRSSDWMGSGLDPRYIRPI